MTFRLVSCPVCGRYVRAIADGRVSKHYVSTPTGKRVCAGRGEKPTRDAVAA